jgi:hypothetical protein
MWCCVHDVPETKRNERTSLELQLSGPDSMQAIVGRFRSRNEKNQIRVVDKFGQFPLRQRHCVRFFPRRGLVLNELMIGRRVHFDKLRRIKSKFPAEQPSMRAA